MVKHRTQNFIMSLAHGMGLAASLGWTFISSLFSLVQENKEGPKKSKQ